MDAGFRTPLLDAFRKGDVTADVRLLAAQGALAPRPLEQLGLLMLLVDDPDPAIVHAAESTLVALPRESVAAFLSRPDVSGEMREFFAARGIEPAGGAGVEGQETLFSSAEAVEDAAARPDGEKEDEGSALQRIAALTVAQRIALAMKGTREERAILIRDPNKIVGAAVLSSPKLTDSEIESYAKMANISEDLLRVIANTRAWIKNYPVVLALAKNPKTPVALSMNLLSRLNDKDLRMLSTDRNVPEVLRITARKKVVIDK